MLSTGLGVDGLEDSVCINIGGLEWRRVGRVGRVGCVGHVGLVERVGRVGRVWRVGSESIADGASVFLLTVTPRANSIISWEAIQRIIYFCMLCYASYPCFRNATQTNAAKYVKYKTSSTDLCEFYCSSIAIPAESRVNYTTRPLLASGVCNMYIGVSTCAQLISDFYW